MSQSKDLQKPLIDKDKGAVSAQTAIADLENTKKKKAQGPKIKEETGPEAQWGGAQGEKNYGYWYFLKFTFPAIWKQGWLLRIQVVITFSLLVLSKVLNVIHPLILKEVINDVTNL